MIFEFDPAKSASNKDKHGIDFVEAQVLWDDPSMIEAPVKASEEQRFIAVGKIGTKHWVAIFSYRNDKRRIISVRRARKEEIGRYESL